MTGTNQVANIDFNYWSVRSFSRRVGGGGKEGEWRVS